MQLEELRRRHPALIYEEFDSHLQGNDLVCTYKFRLEPDIIFTPKLTIHDIPKKVNLGPLQNLIFHVGLAETPSYWKAACPPKIIIKAGQLNKAQVSWWNNLLIKGLGEFFYTNKIDFTDPNFVSWEIDSPNEFFPEKTTSSSKQIFVPIGGGKDSVVTLKLLQNSDYSLKTITLNPTLAARRIIEKAQTDNIRVTRHIDPKLLELNQQGYLNGHTPFSSYLAFLTVLVAEAWSGGQVVISNERSSNEGNVEYLGKKINHQFSKTYEFETRFRDYTKKYLNTKSEYFSLLRPLYELQISKSFSHYPDYLPLIRSCNSTRISDGWCGICPKCLFAFTILYPFVDHTELIKVFKQNLFTNPNLISLADEMVGKSTHKPFECVGTYEETKVAFYLSLKKHIRQLPPLLAHINISVINNESNWDERSSVVLNSWNAKHHLPPDFAKLLKNALVNA